MSPRAVRRDRETSTYVSGSELRSISTPGPPLPSNTTMSRLFFFASSIRALTILSDETLLSSGLWAAGLFRGAGVSSRRTSEESTAADTAGGAEEDAHRPIGEWEEAGRYVPRRDVAAGNLVRRKSSSYLATIHFLEILATMWYCGS